MAGVQIGPSSWDQGVRTVRQYQDEKRFTLQAPSAYNLQGQPFQWVTRPNNGHPLRAAIKVVMGIVSCLL